MKAAKLLQEIFTEESSEHTAHQMIRREIFTEELCLREIRLQDLLLRRQQKTNRIKGEVL